MKLDPQDLETITDRTLEITTGMRKISGKARVITTSARTSRRCCNTSRVSRRLRYSILAAGRGATSRCSHNSATSRLVWKAPRALPPWRVPIAAAKSGSRISSSSICRSSHFDGVFANAALFHVPSQELPHVLLELQATLTEAGWCAVQLKPARSESGRLEPWPLRRLP